MNWVWDSTVEAAIVSGALLLIGTILTVRIKTSSQKVDRVASALETQLTGWKDISTVLRGQVADLQNDNARCNQRVAELQKRNSELDDRCDDLEDTVRKLRREISDLRRDMKRPPPPP